MEDLQRVDQEKTQRMNTNSSQLDLVTLSSNLQVGGFLTSWMIFCAWTIHCGADLCADSGAPLVNRRIFSAGEGKTDNSSKL